MNIEKIEKYLHSDEFISKSEVINAMESGDIEVLGAAYILTDKAWSRIKPELTMEEQCNFMKKYLLHCIAINTDSTDYVYSGFEAAWELANWIKHLQSIRGTKIIIEDVVKELTSIYKQANEETKNRIETGAIEHIFEDYRIIYYFKNWKSDPELKDAYLRCLEWGNAHTE